MQQILFPDVEHLLISAVADGLTAAGMTTHVGSMVPNPRPASFVRIERIGGPVRDRVVDDALVTVEAWATTHPAAWDLAARTRAIVLGLEGTVVDGAVLYGVVEASGPGSLPDPDSDMRRFTWTCQVSTRGRVA